MEKIYNLLRRVSIIWPLCLITTVSCGIFEQKPEVDIEGASIECPDRILAGEQLKMTVRLYADEDVLESAAISIDGNEAETTISYFSDQDCYSISCTVPESCKGEYPVSLALNSEQAYSGNLKVFRLAEKPASTGFPVKMDIEGAYLLLGKAKVTASAVEEVQFYDKDGNIIPGEMTDQKNISGKYSFVSLEHAVSCEIYLPDNTDYTASLIYSYDTDNFVMDNSTGLLMPFRESGMSWVRSFSDDSFCFWTGEEGAPLMQATVYEDNIPSEITDPEIQLDCIHILDLKNSEGKVKISDMMKYGFHATETPDFHEIKVFLNINEVYYGNSVIQMPLISESDMNQNKVIFARAFTVGSELMAVTYTRDYFRLHCADVESRSWEKIGEWERDMSENDWVNVAVQGNRAILFTSNRQYHIVSGRELKTYGLTWGNSFGKIESYVDPVLNDTGNWIYFDSSSNGNSAMYRSRIEGDSLGSPEILGNGKIPQFLFHTMDDMAVIYTGNNDGGYATFNIIIDGNATEVVDTGGLTGNGGYAYDKGAIINPARM